jgi:hypothetical protein
LNFEIINKTADGDVIGTFILTKEEASFVFNIGLNFLAMNGASPFVQDEDESEENMIGPGTETVQ